MLGWFRSLTRVERRTLAACFGGWTLDAFDVHVYSFTIPTLTALWNMSQAQAGIVATATLVTSALGGWLTGMLSDHVGRLRMLQVTILWYAVFTFMSGFTANFEQLFICRALQGFGYGGEWAAGAVLMGEVIRSEYRGRAVGIVQSGWAVGWATAAFLYSLLFTMFPAEYAWRMLFWTGVCPALLVVWIRRHVDESPRFIESRMRGPVGRPPLLLIFTHRYRVTTIKVTLFSIGAHGGYNAVSVWLPTYLTIERGLSVIATGSFLFVLIFGAFCGFIGGALLADRIGRKATFMLSGIGAATMVVLYTQLPISNHAVLFLGFPLGLFANATFAPMGSFMTEIYPTEVRGTGQGFCYNAGRGMGALFPALVGFLSASISLGTAIAILALCAYGVMIFVLFMLPETRGRVLEDFLSSHSGSESPVQS